LRRNDRPISSERFARTIGLFHHSIAVAESATGLALLDAATNAAMGLGGKILEKEGVHRALEANVKLADFAFRQGDDLHPREAKMLEQGGNVSLIAANAVQRLGQHDIELAALSFLQDGLHSRPQNHARA
jgi:hypothetical protein